MTFPFDFFPHTHTGKSGGQVQGFSFLLKIVFTILSSREWKVMIQILPPSFKRSIISSRLSLKTSSSEVVDLLHYEYGWSDSVSNLSGKLQRESLRYREAVELADVLGYDLVWQKRT